MAYIEREKAIKEIRDTYEYEYPTASGAFDEFATMLVPRILKNIPTADVAEVKHGKWKEHFSFDKWHYDCPFCDFGFAIGIRQESPPNYCENCGAKMDKERK